MTTTEPLLKTVPAPGAEPAPIAAKPAGLPDKFWDADTGQVRLGALTSSYLTLEKKLSTMMPAPDTADGKDRMLKAMGVPETPDGYIIDVSHGMFRSDPEVNQKLHALGFTPEQVQAVYDLAAQKLVPMVVQLSDQYKADREVERLTAAFGGADKWAVISRQLLAYGKAHLTPDVLRSLASSFEGVMALYHMMKGGDKPGMSGASTPDAVNEQDLQTMMRDPKYWQQKDPAFIAKVTEGFKRIYSAK